MVHIRKKSPAKINVYSSQMLKKWVKFDTDQYVRVKKPERVEKPTKNTYDLEIV